GEEPEGGGLGRRGARGGSREAHAAAARGARARRDAPDPDRRDRDRNLGRRFDPPPLPRRGRRELIPMETGPRLGRLRIPPRLTQRWRARLRAQRRWWR